MALRETIDRQEHLINRLLDERRFLLYLVLIQALVIIEGLFFRR
jgi:hypothetical protein